MRDYLFSVNKENAYSLQKKFSLDEDETEYLHRNFWPIITLTEIEVDEFQGLLNKEKSEFRKKRGRFVIELFKRDYLDFLIDELNSYLDNINRRRNKIYNVVSDTYFHWFKLEADIKTYTLLLSKKDELNLEIYFIDLLDVIKSFISENEALPPQPIVESPFSVLEWATIFYYADETKLLPESRLLKTRLEQFMNKHQINTTFNNFKTKYYEAKKRINEKNDYPINKLELIIPFLKENYKQAVTKVENEIIFLEENKSEY